MPINLFRWMDVELADVFDALTTVGEGKRVQAGLDNIARRHWLNRDIEVVPVGQEDLALIVVHSWSGCWTGRSSELQVLVCKDADDDLVIAHPSRGDFPDEWTAALDSALGEDCLWDGYWPILWTSGSDGRYHRYHLPDVLAGWALKMAARKEGERIALAKRLVKGHEVGGYEDPVGERGPFLGIYDGLGWEWVVKQRDNATIPPVFAPRLKGPMFLDPLPDSEEPEPDDQPDEEPMADWERELLGSTGGEGE